MTLRSVLPFLRQFAPEPEPIAPGFAERVLQLWDQGKDTLDIAMILFNDRKREASVAVALAFGREQRRRERG